MDKKYDYDPKIHENKKFIEAYSYNDEDGTLRFEKVRYLDLDTGKKFFRFRRPDPDNKGKYIYNLNGITLVPYRLESWKDKSKILICEGEKDTNALFAATGIETTCAPFGAGSWPKELTPWFKNKTVNFCYDIGTEKAVLSHAEKLLSTAKKISIITLPSEEEHYDLSDYLEENKGKEKKTILDLYTKHSKSYPLYDHYPQFVHTFLSKKIPKRDVFMSSVAERESYTMFAGPKGVGKSSLMLQMAVNMARGTDFLTFTVPHPVRVLFINQEISEAAFQERLRLMKIDPEADPLLKENLMLWTTTGHPLKITEPKDQKRIRKYIHDISIDHVIYDTLRTTHSYPESKDDKMNEVLDYFFEFMFDLNSGLTLNHHTRKPGKDFVRGDIANIRGSAVLTDRADIVINIDWLPRKYTQESFALPLDKSRYCELEFNLRNDNRPPNMLLERGIDVWYVISDLYSIIGKKLTPEKVLQTVTSKVGNDWIYQQALMQILLVDASPVVAFNNITMAIKKGYLESETMTNEKGKPHRLRIKRESAREFITRIDKTSVEEEKKYATKDKEDMSVVLARVKGKYKKKEE